MQSQLMCVPALQVRLENVKFGQGSKSSELAPTLELQQESGRSSVKFFSDVNRTVCVEGFAATEATAAVRLPTHHCHGRSESTLPLEQAGANFVRADDPWFLEVQQVRTRVCTDLEHMLRLVATDILRPTTCKVTAHALRATVKSIWVIASPGCAARLSQRDCSLLCVWVCEWEGGFNATHRMTNQTSPNIP